MVILTNIYAYSDTGKTIHRIGSDAYGSKITLLNGDTASSFEEVDEVPRYTKAEYDAKVAELVRRRYTDNEEFALQRKMLNTLLSPATLSEDAAESAADEYAEYNAYVEQCKVRAPQVLIEDIEAREKVLAETEETTEEIADNEDL